METYIIPPSGDKWYNYFLYICTYLLLFDKTEGMLDIFFYNTFVFIFYTPFSNIIF